MNIKQVRYVCAIVELGSFSAAAAREGVSVQAVSKAMAELESALDGSLFERRSVGVTPTPLGRAFAARARRVLDEWEALERFAEGPGAAVAETPFRMGLCCPRYPGVERLVALVSAVSARAVGGKVRTSLASCSDALEELRGGRVDALVTLAPLEADDVACGALGTLASSVLLAADHPLAARDELTLEELGAYPLVCPTSFTHFVSSVVRPYLERGLASPLVEIEVDGEAGERGGVPEGFCGYAFQVAADITGAGEGCVSRPVAASEMVPVPIFLSTLRGSGSVDFVVFRRALSRMLALA